MSQVTYRVVQHDGGWAYKSNEVFSETFKSHDLALAAAKRVAAEQTQSGETVEIEYEGKDSVWRIEHVDGNDRPTTSVED